MYIEYKQAVDTLFEYGSDSLIPNSKPEHAAILLGMIFKYAQKYVYLFCRNLKADVFDNPFLLEQIKRAKEANVSIRILIEDTAVESEQMKAFLQAAPDAEIKRFTGKLNLSSHYAVSDDKAFRLESSHKDTKAVGCAKRPKIAIKLKYLFLEMAQQSVAI